MSFRRVVLGYIVLVLVPIAGLLAVLRAGESLKASPVIEGTWAVSLDSPGDISLCGAKFDGSRLSFKVSQSGSFALVSLGGQNQSSVRGQLEGKSLIAGVRSTDCSRDLFVLNASVDSPRALTGSLTPNGCAACNPIAFHAALVKPRAPIIGR